METEKKSISKNSLFYISKTFGGRSGDGYRHVRATGEFRTPKKGEWFISGAIPEGYLAVQDMKDSYFIGVPESFA